MDRRQFIGAVTGAVAGSALVGCASRMTQEAVMGTLDGDGTAFRAARRYAQTSFGRIAYVERGSGEVALFMHGFPLNSFQWRGAIDRLSADRRCIAPDFMGLGFTEVARGQSLVPDAQVAMLVALLDKLSIQTVDIIASDSGGAVAQLFIVKHPERARTLLLANCDAEPDSPPPALQPVLEMSRKGKFVDEWLVPWHANKTLARSPQGIGGMCYIDPAHPTDAAIDCYFGPLIRTAQSKALVHAYALGLDPNPLAGIEAKLKRSAVPARIVWGTGDNIFSRESPGYLDRTFGNSRGVRLLEGSKLFWPEERPDVIAEEARRLWGIA